jgi:exonuclease VII large subunit
MSKPMLKSMLALAALFATTFLTAQTQISIDSVSAYIGKTVKVCDKVAGTFVTKLVPPKAVGEKPVTYLNLGADYPNTKLTIVIFQKDLINFPFTPSDHYKGMNVCVTGEIGIYKERYRINVRNIDQFFDN